MGQQGTSGDKLRRRGFLEPWKTAGTAGKQRNTTKTQWNRGKIHLEVEEGQLNRRMGGCVEKETGYFGRTIHALGKD